MSSVSRPRVPRHASRCRRVRLGIVASMALAASACGSSPSGTGSGDVPPTAAASTFADPPVTAGPASPGPSSVHPVTTVVVTDDPAVAAATGAPNGGWIGHLAEGLQQAGAPVSVTSAADAAAGFAAAPPGGASFTDLVDRHVEHATQLVIFFETDLTSDSAAVVAEGALEAFNAVEEAAPDGRVVVVGSFGYTGSETEPPADVRQAVRDAADRAEVAVDYIDPVAEEWPAGLEGKAFADRLQGHIVELVTALSRSGAFD
jgi:hypothetical protein